MKDYIGLRAVPEMDYYSPDTVEEALGVLNSAEGLGCIIAGGTDLLPALRSGKLNFSEKRFLLDLQRIEELKKLRIEENCIRIGTALTITELIESKEIQYEYPALTEALSQIGSPQIRNRATIGGNLCNASPAADSAVPLLVLDAVVALYNTDGRRELPLTDFFLGPGKTVLKPKEFLGEILLPRRSERMSAFIKIGRRNTFTLSVVSGAVSCELRDNAFREIRIALGAVAPVPMRIASAEQSLEGREATLQNVNKVIPYINQTINPISDVRSSAEYRREMATTVIQRSLEKILSSL